MFDREENENLTNIGPGSLMGDLVRQYWIPFFASNDLTADGQPTRVRLMGEDLIVFRDSGGHVGLMAANCPHRGGPLYYARNEDCGLRCVYHGWKFDVAGRCVDMPNEPPNSRFKEHIRLQHYPCEERNGVIWTYMGSAAEPPELPLMEWNCVPEEQCFINLRVQACNFLQAVEGEYDSSHVKFLHGGLAEHPKSETTVRSASVRYRESNTYPRFQSLDTDYGVLIGARYDAEADSYYWRIYPFMMPFYTVINVNPTYDPDVILFSGHAFVPMDNENTLALGFTWHPNRPLSEEERSIMIDGFPNGLEGIHPTAHSYRPSQIGQPYADYWPKLMRDNDYGFDAGAQRRGDRWCGIPGLWPQDAAMQEGFGPIYDRTREHLGSADLGQVAIRRRLLRAAHALRTDGAEPPGVGSPDAFWLRPTEAILPRETVAWQDIIEESMRGPFKEASVSGLPQSEARSGSGGS